MRPSKTSHQSPRAEKALKYHIWGTRPSAPVTISIFSSLSWVANGFLCKFTAKRHPFGGQTTPQSTSFFGNGHPKVENYVIGTQKPTNSEKKLKKLTDHFQIPFPNTSPRKTQKHPNTGLIPVNIEHWHGAPTASIFPDSKSRHGLQKASQRALLASICRRT